MNRFVMVMALVAAVAVSTAGQSFGQAPAPFTPGTIKPTGPFGKSPNPLPVTRQQIFLLNVPPTPSSILYIPTTQMNVLLPPSTTNYYFNNLYLGGIPGTGLGSSLGITYGGQVISNASLTQNLTGSFTGSQAQGAQGAGGAAGQAGQAGQGGAGGVGGKGGGAGGGIIGIGGGQLGCRYGL